MKVVCIDNDKAPYLTIDKSYSCELFDNYLDYYLVIDDINNGKLLCPIKCIYHRDRFKLIEEVREQKLNQILNEL